MSQFTNEAGIALVHACIRTIQENKQWLSDIDGQIGDGDHGINMNKGFTLCQEALEKESMNLTDGLKTLYQILMNQIGGSMGPLYGMFFRGMMRAAKGKVFIDAQVFGAMLEGALVKIRDVSEAKPGDKTLMDALVPAVETYKQALAEGDSFSDALDRMRAAAKAGRDSTRDMVARLGRSSRLGERSRGVLDAGASSCTLILDALAQGAKGLM